jgi:hypothetical protein
MRLWTLHPGHLDAKGLVALWREGLLARKVLRGRTKGYQHHPQLLRFREHPDPVAAINSYLSEVLAESRRRGYRFDARKILGPRTATRLAATRGQVTYEWQHLRRKLKSRDPSRFRLSRREKPATHPLFRLVPGPIALWERILRS